MHKLLITGTDTDVGKTWISCLLIRQLRSEGVAVGAYKPVCSGAIDHGNRTLTWPDVEQLADAIEWTGSRDQICPQRFRAAVAPNVAAELEDLAVHDALLASGLKPWESMASHVIVEGAGGLLCPLSDQSTVADLAAKLNACVLIVAANRLGVINHTLLTVQAALARRLTIAGMVLNDVTPADSNSDESR